MDRVATSGNGGPALPLCSTHPERSRGMKVRTTSC